MATRYENVLDNFGRLRILSLGSKMADRRLPLINSFTVNF